MGKLALTRIPDRAKVGVEGSNPFARSSNSLKSFTGCRTPGRPLCISTQNGTCRDAGKVGKSREAGFCSVHAYRFRNLALGRSSFVSSIPARSNASRIASTVRGFGSSPRMNLLIGSVETFLIEASLRTPSQSGARLRPFLGIAAVGRGSARARYSVDQWRPNLDP